MCGSGSVRAAIIHGPDVGETQAGPGWHDASLDGIRLFDSSARLVGLMIQYIWKAKFTTAFLAA